MPILNVREMGTIGVISDVAPWDLPPSALTDGMNFRASSGKIETVGGLRDAIYKAADGNDNADEIGHLSQGTDLEGNSSWLVLGEKTINEWDGVSSIDRLNGLTTLSIREPADWSTCRVGAQTFMNHPDSFPMSWGDWNNADQNYCKWLPFGPGKTWEQAGCSTFVLRAHKNFLWALGMVENGEILPDRVRWSHPMESNGVPYSWMPPDDVDASSIAGYVDLGRGGAVVGGESLRDRFVIYSDEAINVMDFTGDALGWRRRSVSSSAGLIGKEAVIEVNGIHYFISRDDILMFDGNQVSSLLHNRLRKRLAQTINYDSAERCWAAHNANFNEIWFCIPEAGDDYPSTAFVFNYRDGTWALRDLEKQFRHGRFGASTTKFDYRTWEDITPTTKGAPLPDDYFDQFEGSWDVGRASWHLITNQPFSGVQYGASGTQIFNTDPQEPEGNPESYISRTDLPIGGHEVNTTVTRVYPMIEGTAEVEMRFGSQQMAGGPVRWAGGWQRFDPNTDRKLDIRTTGELHAFEVRAVDAGFFNLTGFDIEYSLAGTR
jgi:hypothetical protein